MRKSPRRGIAVLTLACSVLLAAGCSVIPSTGNGSSTKLPTPATSMRINGSITPRTAGVILTLRGPATATTTTDSSGNYSFGGVPAGTYTLTPTKSQSVFKPASQSLKLADSDVSALTFEISSGSSHTEPFSISGAISPAAAGAGATVTLIGPTNATTTADTSGRYTFGSLPEGMYRLIPNKSQYTFDPPSRNAVVASSDAAGIDFTAEKDSDIERFLISGNISPAGSGVDVMLSGAANASTTTDAAGNYSFRNVPSGTYTVTPSESQHTFIPPSKNTVVSTSNVAGVNFISSKGSGPTQTYTISGTISPIAGGAGATVKLSGASNASTTTDTSGNYSFSGLAGGTYQITPSEASYTFNPSSKSETISSSNIGSVNFTASASSISGVQVYPGQDIAAVVNGSPAGTTFVIHPGTYRLTQTIMPKDGDNFVGQTPCAPPQSSCPAIITGSTLIGSLATFDGKNYVVRNQTQHGGRGQSGICDNGWSGCIYPEDLFFDGVPYKHLDSSSLPAIGPGQWWFDYSNHAIYFHDNPSGHVVETSVLYNGFGGSGNDITLQYLTVKEFANMYPYSAIGAPQGGSPQSQGANWTVRNSEILLNHGSGVRVNYGMQILNSYIHDNGQLGIGGGLGDSSNPSTAGLNSQVLIQGNLITHNDYAHFSPAFGAGGFKVGSTSGVTLRGNTIQNNEGSGIHFDVSSQSEWVEGNTITDNSDGDGIVQELGYGNSTIRNNIVLRNGIAVADSYSDFQISVRSSSGVNAYCNVIEIPKGAGINGWAVIASNRGYSTYPPYQYLSTTGNSFHHNTVIWDTGATGIVGFLQQDAANEPNFFASNSRPDFSTYYLSNSSAARFIYDDNDSQNNIRQTFSRYQAALADVHGTLDTSYSGGYPQVAITSPADQSLMSSPLAITVAASDTSGISKVEFYVDWNLQSSVTGSLYNLSLSNIGSGTHTLTAMAYSNAGIRACHAVTVNVQ